MALFSAVKLRFYARRRNRRLNTPGRFWPDERRFAFFTPNASAADLRVAGEKSRLKFRLLPPSIGLFEISSSVLRTKVEPLVYGTHRMSGE